MGHTDDPMSEKADVSIWGKSKGLQSPYPLIAHLVDTAAFAYAFFEISCSFRCA
ncbi:MAG: hypothetical protein M1483_01565 [Actinobacteria bacterium]|nr:hypothetical protein [Actinomycetota bacterium]